MNNIVTLFLDFFKFMWIRRSPSLPFTKAGFAFIFLSLPTGPLVEFLLSYEGVSAGLKLETTESLPSIIRYFFLGFGGILIIYGLFIHRKHLKKIGEETSRKRVVIIEHRGLTVPINISVKDAVPIDYIGRREAILIDQTPFVDGNNKVAYPDRSLKEVTSIREKVDDRIKEVDKDDVIIVYGGIASVPFTFLTGYLIDDDNKVSVFDWDRVKGSWRAISSCNRHKEAKVTGLAEAKDAEEIVVALSVSYAVDLDAISRCFPDLPLVHMDTEDHQPNNHWDKDQQDKWVEQFIGIIRSLGHIKKIHLIIAAQNSVAFQLGRSYDRRNCPDLLVYQYERDEEYAYPWAVEVPRKGNGARIIMRDAISIT